MIKNFKNNAFENLIIHLNSSNSSKKENPSKNKSLRGMYNPKQTIVLNNLKTQKNNCNSYYCNNTNTSEMLTTLLRGLISLKQNNLFDYIIKLLNLILCSSLTDTKHEENNGAEDNFLNCVYQQILQIFSTENKVIKNLITEFNNDKKILKNKHYIFIFYIHCGIEYIKEISDKEKKIKINHINNKADYNEILNILLQFADRENCQGHYNENNCGICHTLNKLDNIENIVINTNNDFNSKHKRKSTLNIEAKSVLESNRHKNLMAKQKIRKNISSFTNSDISLKLLKSNLINKITTNKKNTNQNITNKVNDKKLLNYLKTTIDDKIILKTHREFQAPKKEKIDAGLNNYMWNKGNNTNTNSSSAINKIYTYSYKNNNNSKKNNIKENNSLQNFYSGNKTMSNTKRKNNSNVNISNNQQIFYYPKVEQYLNNVYIINDNKEINSNIFHPHKNSDVKVSKDESENAEIEYNKEIKDKSSNIIKLLNSMNVVGVEIKSMDNIIDNFNKDTLKIKSQMKTVGKKDNK